MKAANPLKLVLGYSIIDVVVPLSIPTLTPVKLIFPIVFVFIPVKVVLKSVFNILIL